ncbi:MAG: bifunctional 23S rRNA (guanine(2069)-N(7))-methyltransferase RlmK/23S rRNA (guanine(2445)-N(2))-methyltransferase RlmL [Deltaproteobacteria bacterium]|nr:MAG: bifunctional 23S rRNA (guanine(2069)-N(7))-methyltransferase RlmK/23S rRNA (guanine(2445)-N(2))-methyltransferase RlmL [Desulfobacterales bacterium]PIE72192.1 MAG: bifunctional 23S rRNA (guanine(2069)-N(7))-methyltransferase RlmK/23S rRNA (guanine(2445)-N(2))-methyltransferase RlmL [Deltaproteobacteria bacterium]
MENQIFTATCATGLENLVKDEITAFGGQEIHQKKGAISWTGTLATGYRACLWSRFASRILLEIAHFQAKDEEALYSQARQIPWQKHLTTDTTFAVQCTISGKTAITHNRYAALKVKDALADDFMERENRRPSVQVGRPGVQFHLHIQDRRATIFVDLSGESLHQRGYRTSGTVAPLKENLAAGLVALSGWPAEKTDLIDPMCGSGTLLVEAALFFADAAPGLGREYFGFLGWRPHNERLWQELQQEAVARKTAGFSKKWPVFEGYDADPKAIAAARKNIKRAGLEDRIQLGVAELASIATRSGKGMLLANLPYGKRLSETELVGQLYRAYGRIARERFTGWQLAAFISNPELIDHFSLTWRQKEKIHNGPIPCRLLITEIPREKRPDFTWSLPREKSDDAFANRLVKNMKKMLQWARREGVHCYRVYNRDLPEYNFSIDLYGKWLHIQEYAPPKSVDQERAEQRLRKALAIIRETLGIRSNRIFIKRRMRQRGGTQYQKKGNQQKLYEVQEGPCWYLVNFTDYLDTGLFLDHRPLRQRIYKISEGKRFLNLFAYTGSATVQAAMAGAAATTTVDLSATYLEWARSNLALNGFSEIRHSFVQEDSLAWLTNRAAKYDLIFVDPPTFSNTKKKRRVFDIQRDHQRLIDLAMACLEKDGLLLFSTNFRRFKLNPSLHKRFRINDITPQTIPFDFARDPRIHQCWEIRH